MAEEINAKAVELAGFETRYAAIQIAGVEALAAPAGDTDAVIAAAQELVKAADKARARDFATGVRKFIVAYAQFVIEKNVVALKGAITAALPDLASLKLAAEIVKKALKALVVPKLNKELEGLQKHFKGLNDILKKAGELDIGGDDIAKAQKDLEAALKKIDEALKKIEEEAKKKKDEAKPGEKPAEKPAGG